MDPARDPAREGKSLPQVTRAALKQLHPSSCDHGSLAPSAGPTRVRLFMTPWLSMEFSRQEYWSGLPFPSPPDLPDPGIEHGSSALQADSLPTEPLGKPVYLENTRKGPEGSTAPSAPRPRRRAKSVRLLLGGSCMGWFVTEGSTPAGSRDSLNLQRGGWDLGRGQPLSHCVEAIQPLLLQVTLTGQPWSWGMATTPALSDKDRKSPLKTGWTRQRSQGAGMLLPAPGSQRPDIKGSVSSNLKAE